MLNGVPSREFWVSSCFAELFLYLRRREGMAGGILGSHAAQSGYPRSLTVGAGRLMISPSEA